MQQRADKETKIPFKDLSSSFPFIVKFILFALRKFLLEKYRFACKSQELTQTLKINDLSINLKASNWKFDPHFVALYQSKPA